MLNTPVLRLWYWQIESTGTRCNDVEGLNLFARNQPAFIANAANAPTMSVHPSPGAIVRAIASFSTGC